MATSACIGFRALRGGAVAVAVALEAGEPRLASSSFLATAAQGDSLAFEPYTTAAAMAGAPTGQVSPEMAAAVAEGRRRQNEEAAHGLTKLLFALSGRGYDAASAALLVNRAGWITDLLEYSLFASEHLAVAEGLAVREALRIARRQAAVECVEWDEKSLAEQAGAALDLSPTAIDLKLTALGNAAGRPWRREQKLACLAAWLTLATGR